MQELAMCHLGARGSGGQCWRRTIQKIAGVQVAAPIAMLGYAQLDASMFVSVPTGALAGRA
jgi:hypothetical protein